MNTCVNDCFKHAPGNAQNKPAMRLHSTVFLLSPSSYICIRHRMGFAQFRKLTLAI
jgi:hypothetical protein